MFDVFNELATDEALELNGTWRDIGKGAKLLLARSNNRRFARLMNKLYEQNREVLDAEGDEADKMSDKLIIQTMAETVLLGWQGISYKGQPLDHSLDNAKMLLAHADFRSLVTRKAGEIDGYKMVQEAEQGKA